MHGVFGTNIEFKIREPVETASHNLFISDRGARSLTPPRPRWTLTTTVSSAIATDQRAFGGTERVVEFDLKSIALEKRDAQSREQKWATVNEC
ncbi:hypothetical protein EVAR_40822_1 [Eumeta japonica]|uniref:Uncharacterized protein n=1 Tax=Eumeta variegata TaxID=151549 RepID=A0A4C1WHE7_EUMVA|nr:hypothetical protein EVAR_40822_1 [Eumeta japonica]